jgi:hypothetical protein
MDEGAERGIRSAQNLTRRCDRRVDERSQENKHGRNENQRHRARHRARPSLDVKRLERGDPIVAGAQPRDQAAPESWAQPTRVGLGHQRELTPQIVTERLRRFNLQLAQTRHQRAEVVKFLIVGRKVRGAPAAQWLQHVLPKTSTRLANAPRSRFMTILFVLAARAGAGAPARGAC